VLTSASGAQAEPSPSSDATTAAGVLKLDANEATIPTSPLVQARLRAFIEHGGAASYPDSEALALRRHLASYTSRSEAEVLAFNGCDAAIDCAVRTFATPGDRMCVAGPTYDRFRRCAEAAGASVTTAYGRDPFTADVTSLLEAIGDDTCLVYLSNPDNPTGRTFSDDGIADLLSRLHRGVLIVDETYFEFAGLTAIPLIDRFDNLLVMRSFSKAFGLAGLRCGYTISNRRLAERMRRFWSGRDVNAAVQEAAIAALDDSEYMQAYVDEVTAARAWLAEGLRSLGHTVVSTPANFVLMRVADPAGFVERMREKRIELRDRSQLPQLEGFVRITVGTLSQCEHVLETIREIDPLSA
jgi:histidinol-phosphate aminotransferase